MASWTDGCDTRGRGDLGLALDAIDVQVLRLTAGVLVNSCSCAPANAWWKERMDWREIESCSAIQARSSFDVVNWLSPCCSAPVRMDDDHTRS